MNLSRIVERNAADRGEQVAIEFGSASITWAELARRVDLATVALGTNLGVHRGDRVAFLGFNNPEMLVLLFALSRLGAILVPLNFRLALPEHRYILGHCGARVVFAEPEFHAHLAPLVAEDAAGESERRFVSIGEPSAGWSSWAAVAAEPRARASTLEYRHGGGTGHDADPVLLVYTSGTTGRPKGVLLTQANLLWNAFNSVHVHEMTSADRVLTNLPLFHVGGLNVQTLPALYCAARVHLQPRFDAAAALAAFAAFRPTLSLVVPATLRAMVEHADFAATPLDSLRLLMTGSMNTPDALIDSIHRRGVPVGQVYGATETAPIAICLRRDDAFDHVGYAGKPAPHTEIRLMKVDGTEAARGEEGEIWVRGPHVMREYWEDPQLTAAAFVSDWYRTGDVGVADADGFVRVSGRVKEMIISGGENIYPAEIENVLADCPDIAEAVVVGAPDPRWGEVPVACVVRRPGTTIDERGVLGLFVGRLARYKHPHRVVFLPALPRNAMGKVQKQAITV